MATVTACLLLAAAVIAGLSLAAARKTARREAVRRYFERFWEKEFLENAESVLSAWGVAPDQPDSARQAKVAEYNGATPVDRTKILRVTNFYEELATMYCAGVLDKKISLSMLGGHSRQAWDSFSWLIKPYQNQSSRYFDKWALFDADSKKRIDRLDAADKKKSDREARRQATDALTWPQLAWRWLRPHLRRLTTIRVTWTK